jgi:hypothetical protein
MNDRRYERLQVTLPPEELAAVDDFRFKHRMPEISYAGKARLLRSF